MRYKYQNVSIIYIYLNEYLCFYFSVSFAFPLLFQWIFFSCLSKVVLLLTSRWNRCFFMFICLLILYDRLSLCFVVCFSSWLLGFYVFIYLIKYVYVFLFGFIVFWLLLFSFIVCKCFLFLFKCSFLILYVCSFLRSLFSFVLLFICLCYYLNVQIVNYKDI